MAQNEPLDDEENFYRRACFSVNRHAYNLWTQHNNYRQNLGALMEFNFDEWSALYRSDPEEFERRRTEEIRKVIAAAPATSRRRIEGLQFRIDMERRRAKTPLAACIALNRMMWDSFMELQQALRDLLDAAEAKTASPGAKREAARVAQVLPFMRVVERRARPRTAP